MKNKYVPPNAAKRMSTSTGTRLTNARKSKGKKFDASFSGALNRKVLSSKINNPSSTKKFDVRSKAKDKNEIQFTQSSLGRSLEFPYRKKTTAFPVDKNKLGGATLNAPLNETDLITREQEKSNSHMYWKKYREAFDKIKGPPKLKERPTQSAAPKSGRTRKSVEAVLKPERIAKQKEVAEELKPQIHAKCMLVKKTDLPLGPCKRMASVSSTSPSPDHRLAETKTFLKSKKLLNSRQPAVDEISAVRKIFNAFK